MRARSYVLVILLFMVGALGGCAGRFSIAFVNDTKVYLVHLSCKYDHYAPWPDTMVGQGYSAIYDSTRPKKGPILIHWQEENGPEFQAEVPFKKSYDVKPEGILVLRFRPDHTVSVRGIGINEYEEAPWFEVGDVYQGVKVPPMNKLGQK